MLKVQVNQGAPPFKLRVTFETRAGAAQVVVTEPTPQALIRLSYMLKGDKGDALMVDDLAQYVVTLPEAQADCNLI